MAREVTVETPVDPSQFGPDQIRPRALLAQSIGGLARWFAAHLVPYPRLLNDHATGLVFTTVRLQHTSPGFRFGDADWLEATSRVSVSDSAKYLSLDVDFRARRDTQARADRPVGSFHADLRVVTVVEDKALSAVPGTLPDPLLALFRRDEIYEPDRAALARASTPPDGREIFAGAGYKTTIFRSQCEVADQWSFIEVMEMMTAARERLFLDSAPEAVGRLAVADPPRHTAATFHRALYVFDTCEIATRVVAAPGDAGFVAFVHTLEDPAHPGPCVTAWEVLAPS